MTFDKSRHEKNEEVEEAEEAKEREAEKDGPGQKDTSFMPNIVPQTGDDDDSTPAERATK